MLPAEKFRCPACGFAIHNRAYPKCERCHAALPPDLVLSKDEVAKQWKEMQAEREKSRQQPETGGVGSYSADFGSFPDIF